MATAANTPSAPKWIDKRLSQATDLIYAVRSDHNEGPESELVQFLNAALEAVEAADVELEKGL